VMIGAGVCCACGFCRQTVSAEGSKMTAGEMAHGAGAGGGPHPARGSARAAPPPKQPGRGAVGVACRGRVRADASAWRGAGEAGERGCRARARSCVRDARPQGREHGGPPPRVSPTRRCMGGPPWARRRWQRRYRCLRRAQPGPAKRGHAQTQPLPFVQTRRGPHRCGPLRRSGGQGYQSRAVVVPRGWSVPSVSLTRGARSVPWSVSREEDSMVSRATVRSAGRS